MLQSAAWKLQRANHALYRFAVSAVLGMLGALCASPSLRKATALGRLVSLSALALVVTLPACAKREAFAGTTVDSAAPPLVLRKADGTTFSLADHRTGPSVIFFGYAHCPDVCPTTLSMLSTVRKRLGATDAARTQVIFVSVDPERDTPADAMRYAQLFDPSFIGLSGNVSDMTAIYRDWHIWRQRLPGSKAAGYAMAHSSGMYLVDASDRVRVVHDWSDTPASITHDLRLLE